MTPLRAWIAASRLPTLPAALVPVLVGTALAARDGAFHPIACAAALAGALAIQVGTNLANDYFDWKRGADTHARLGPLRATQAGLIAPERVLAGAWIAFGVAALSGLVLVALRGWPMAALGVASIAAGVLYTGGPLPYGYVGLGDPVCFLFFGIAAVCGTYYAQAGTVTAAALAASLPVGLTVTAILVVNNLRDIDTDREAGKHTLAVILGRGGSRAEYASLLAGAFVGPPVLWMLDLAPAAASIACAAALLAPPLLRAVFADPDGPRLNATLRGTARLHLVFGALFALGLLAGGAP
jgi:1,4-dihydroxy-2-naphthoate octaprenyltransferase